ncbi:hypothetical protein [Neotabrizicola shimadae]|uniref:Uncharacterized protein n=1 Tax=Neotabrizicola shimadae TaxID=2807096 RepID=A0A8G1EEL3_9RHOB|nr:hypothetical protein [Neotabrizicola shimadae]QYZ70769.1 hypothetical protein JO391_04440 [Neotabrizicola shimadae]
MQELVELERRIAAALDRIGRGIEGLAPEVPAAPAAQPVADPAEVTQLREALEEERFINAQLTEKLRAAREKAVTGQTQALLAAKVERMTKQLDVQGLELQRMRKTVVQLRETLRALREAVTDGMPDAAMINRALLAETEALRATRLTELSLLDEILDELEPLIPETGEDA